MTDVETGVTVIEAPRRRWRCGWPQCIVRPLLALYTDAGGVHVKATGRFRHPQHYIWDLNQASLIAHCPACHQWRELYRDPETGTVAEDAYAGPLPDIECACRRD